MFSIEKLTISGHRNEPVTNSFFKQEAGAGHLAIVLPGLSYRCDAPLLWYSTKALISLGADVLWVEYAYDLRSDWVESDGRARKDWLFDDAVAATKAAMGARYEQVTFVGKSLGTLAMGHLLSTQKFPDRTKAAWLTPVLSDPDLRRQLEAVRLPSLLVIGAKDHYYDEAFLRRLRANKAVEIQVIRGADHSIETEEGVLASIDNLRLVMNLFQRFVSE